MNTTPGKSLTTPPPIEPDPEECCGRGCVPCIYDYYEKALSRWKEKNQFNSLDGNNQDS